VLIRTSDGAGNLLQRRYLAQFATAVASIIVLILASPVPARAEPGLQSALTALAGQGTGHLSLSPTARDKPGLGFAVGTANVHGALPNTHFLVQRAADPVPDGVCTIAPEPPAGWLTLTTLTTSPAGSGAAHFVRRTSGGPRGDRFNVIARLVSDDGTQLLQSSCLTVTFK
jgi:hypothetical protein